MSKCPVVPEGALIDPYLEHGQFYLRAEFGSRARADAWIHEIAATHEPPLRISVTPHGTNYLRVVVLAP